MRMVWLLLVLVCILGYVHAEQPATWNSWMVAIGATGLVIPATTDQTNAASVAGSPDVPPSAPARVVPVGGLLQDGGFASPAGLWLGDGKPDASGKGLVVTLNPTAWTRVYQAFAGDANRTISIEVTYKLSPGLTVSKNPADYTDIDNRLQIDGFENFRSIAVYPGNFYGTVGDPTSTSISCEVFTPQYGSTDVQDYQHTYPPIPPNRNDTFALAFPPGTGTITLLTAYVTSR